MKIRKIILNNKELSYIFRQYKRSKRLKLIIRSDASIVVSAPARMSEKRASKFLLEKADWILERIEFFQKQNKGKQIKTTKKDYLKQKEKARTLILQKLEELNKFYKFRYNRISIRNQKTRWGSCSRKGNLNFNYRIIYLPEKLANYIIVHELCHLREMNHSSRFWNLVAKTFPAHKLLRKELKKESLTLF
jgi:predicted metal-dependent hydrolase